MDDPRLQTALVPFLVSLALGALGLAAAPLSRWRRWAASAPLLAFLLFAVLVLGVPSIPPAGASHKIMLIGALALLGALLVAGSELERRIGLLLLIAWPAGLAWIAMRPLVSGRGIEVASILVLGSLGLWWCRPAEMDHRSGPVYVVVCAAGLSVIALVASSGAIAQLAGALAAAQGAAVLLDWPRPRIPASPVVRSAMAVLLVLLCAQASLYTSASSWLLCSLLLAFPFGRLGVRAADFLRMRGEIGRQSLVGFFASIPIMAAVAFALQAATSDYTVS